MPPPVVFKPKYNTVARQRELSLSGSACALGERGSFTPKRRFEIGEGFAGAA
jgi:hypothetical protein